MADKPKNNLGRSFNEREKTKGHHLNNDRRKSRIRSLSTESCQQFETRYKHSIGSIGNSVELMTLSIPNSQLESIGNIRNFSDSQKLAQQKVYRVSSVNSMITLYLPTRELVANETSSVHLDGILHVNTETVEDQTLFTQLTLTFRYGREDEEVMGLRFCNEAIMSVQQILPKGFNQFNIETTPFQNALINCLGDKTYPFKLTLPPQSPPSVQLIPAKSYNGAPIGTTYEVRCLLADTTEDKINHKSIVKMSIRVIHRVSISKFKPEELLALANAEESLAAIRPQETNRIRLYPKNVKVGWKFGRSKSEAEGGAPHEVPSGIRSALRECKSCGVPRAVTEKPFPLQEGRVNLEASLDKPWYTHGEDIIVSVDIKNDSKKIVRKIRISAVQHVDVCMFNNGKFKNIVAEFDQNTSDDHLVEPGNVFKTTFVLKPKKGNTKNWIALEDSLDRHGGQDEFTDAIAASAVRYPTPCPVGFSKKEERNIFAIYVSYYVKVKLSLSGMGGELALKLPFALIHVAAEDNSNGSALKNIISDPEPVDEEKEIEEN